MKIQNLVEYGNRARIAFGPTEQDPENDPYDAREALHQDIVNLAQRVDFFFGSAGDVADRNAKRRMAAAINSIRPMVQAFGEQLEVEVKKADKKVHNALKRFY